MSSDYTVQLEQLFQGPMDLLLHLVREQEVEIQEVEIHRVIDGYFEYLGRLEQLDIETAGDFLVMAATLMAGRPDTARTSPWRCTARST